MAGRSFSSEFGFGSGFDDVPVVCAAFVCCQLCLDMNMKMRKLLIVFREM